MLNVEKLCVLIEHDVIWLNIIYFDPAKVTQDQQVELIDNDNKKPIKSGDSVVKVIFDGDDGDNALTYVESDVDGITRDDGNVEGNTEYGDDTNDPTGTDENTNYDDVQLQKVETTNLERVSGCGKNLAQEQLGITTTQTN